MLVITPDFDVTHWAKGKNCSIRFFIQAQDVNPASAYETAARVCQSMDESVHTIDQKGLSTNRTLSVEITVGNYTVVAIVVPHASKVHSKGIMRDQLNSLLKRAIRTALPQALNSLTIFTGTDIVMASGLLNTAPAVPQTIAQN